MKREGDSGCHPIRTDAARKELINVAKGCVRSNADAGRTAGLIQMAREELLRNLGSVSAVLLLLLGYALSKDRRATTLAHALLALCSLLIGVLIKVVSRRCEAFELLDRVSGACEEFEQGSRRAESKFAGSNDTPVRQSWRPLVGLQQGSALASVVSVCRDGLWQRVPMLLLVKGDVVALMGGDRAPCRMELLRIEENNVEDHVKHGVRVAGVPGAVGAEPAVGAPKAVSLVFHEAGTQVLAGEYIEFRPETGEQLKRKTMISATSPALLTLCGDMRCYRLLETPLEDHLKMSLSPGVSSRRSSLLRERIRAAATRCYRSVLIAVVLAALAGGIRLVLAEGSRGAWALFLLVIPGQVAVCLLPLSLPIYLTMGEAVATARLLAFLELMLGRKRETKGVGAGVAVGAGASSSVTGEYDEFDQMDAEEREEATSGTSHTVSWRKARAYLTAVLKTRWNCGARFRQPRHRPPGERNTTSCMSKPQNTTSQSHGDGDVGLGQQPLTPPRSARFPATDEKKRGEAENRSDSCLLSDVLPSSREFKEHDEKFQDGNSDNDRVGILSPPSEWWRTMSCFGWWPWKRHAGTAARTKTYSEATAKQQLPGARTLLPVPMLECGLVERLGAVTTLCMLDEDTVCKPTAAVKEVFIVDSKDDAGGGSGTVLDMHNQQGNNGVRFEDPQWWIHLPSLKPIGLTCLLAEARHTERLQARSRSVHSPAAAIGRATPSAHRRQKHDGPGRALLDHVRDSHPMEHLSDLWKAIGFSMGDRTIFREKRRIHVINPKLTADRATEDTHAQGQDESRRRGTIQPHVTAVVAQDRRSDTLQLLSQGHPSIILGMCPDYWDGSAISNLPGHLSKSILNMHQQWSLEDLDVVAFAYTPVPHTANPCLSTFTKYPDYLIHRSQFSTKSRSRGGVSSPVPIASKTGVDTRQGAAKHEVADHVTSTPGASTTRQSGRATDDKLLKDHGDHGAAVPIMAMDGYGGRPRLLTTYPGTHRVDPMAFRQLLPEIFSPRKPFLKKGVRPEGTQDAEAEAEVGSIGTGRTRMRGASESGLDQARAPEKALSRSNSSSTIVDRNLADFGCSVGSVNSFEGILQADDKAAHFAKKVVKFKANNKPDGQMSDDLHSLQVSLSHDNSKTGSTCSTCSTGSVRVAPVANDKRSGRRYSVDDCGIAIAHRTELNVVQPVDTVLASEESKMADALWNLLHEQVFLGMAASFVPPKRDIVALIEDVEAAGVRFVYFSPRNMRRSKALAESMGIETDWNCAISLRPLEDSTKPDPHRMTSDYADWDVKARLPHGIVSIRDHIEKVDNVPLLVSLFTDATPQTTQDMIGIYQEYHESVLAVGMSHRAVNADLFRAADLSLSVEGLPLNQPLMSLPVASASCFSAIDAAFNSKLVGLHAALPLGDAVRSGGAIGGLDEVGSVIIDLVREGRRLLTNSYQALSFLLLASFTVALLVLFAAGLPISHPMTLGGDHLIWILWVVAPLLAMSFLASPADGSLMKRTPEKNDPKVVPIAPRLVVHLLLRTIPTILVCLGLYVSLVGEFLIMAYPELASTCAGQADKTKATWVEMIWCRALEDADGRSIRAVAQQAADLVLVELVLCLTAQSAGFMYRTASILKEHPWKNWTWTYVVVVIFLLQVTYLWASAAARQTVELLSNCPWEPLVVGAVCPFLILALGELVKRHDARTYDRYVTLLRLEFDTRLGMHSPR